MLPELQPDPNVAEAFHLKCPVPTCMSSEANVFVRSATIVTFRCTTCRFTWSARIGELPPPVRRSLDALSSLLQQLRPEGPPRSPARLTRSAMN